MRTGSLLPLLAALRNLVIGMLRLVGQKHFGGPAPLGLETLGDPDPDGPTPPLNRGADPVACSERRPV